MTSAKRSLPAVSDETYYCCDEVKDHIEKYGQWMGGSHYHCGRCGNVASMMGDFTIFCSVTKTKRQQHFCCPGNCELEK